MKNRLITAAKIWGMTVLMALAVVGVLAGCTSAPEETSVVLGDVAEEKVTIIPPLGEEVMAWLVEQAGGPAFSYGYEYVPLDTVDVYIASGISGQLVVEERETGDRYALYFPFSGIMSIQETAMPGQLAFATNGQVFDYDQIFYTGVSSVTVDYRTGEMVGHTKGMVGETTLGFVRGGDSFVFASCVLEDGALSFQFESEGTDYMQYPCGEIRIQAPAEFDPGACSYLFLDTAYTLEADLAAMLEEIEGIQSATFEVVDMGNFQGTLIDIRCEEGFRPMCTFTRGGDPAAYEGVYLSAEPIG